MSSDTHAAPTLEDADEASAAAFLEQQIAAEHPNLPAHLRRSLAGLGASIAKKNATQTRPEPTPSPTPAKILQFPLPFGEETRAVSNPLARGSLFAAVKDRQHFKNYVLVYEEDGMKIEFKGEQLNQDDHDTLLQLVTMALYKPFGADIVQAVNAVLSGMGRTTHQEQRRQLIEQISRLVCGTVRLITPDFRYEGHLLDDAITPQDQAILPRLRRHLAYRLNPKFARFYAETAYTLFDSQERGKLKGRGSELAKWLHLWIIGNAQQYPHKVETIRQLCGSQTKDLKSFRQMLRQAFDLLKEAGIITAWNIDPKSDLVTIERKPSPAQIRHIITHQQQQKAALEPEAQSAPAPEPQPQQAANQKPHQSFWAALKKWI